MMKWQKNNAFRVGMASALDESELKGMVVIGVLVDRESPTYHEKRKKLLPEKLKV